MSDYLLWLRNFVNHLDKAMLDEGIPDETRDRVVSRIMYGTPERDEEGAQVSSPSVNVSGL